MPPKKKSILSRPKKLEPLEDLISGIFNHFKTHWQKLCLASFLMVTLPQIAFFIFIWPFLFLMPWALYTDSPEIIFGIVIFFFLLLMLSLVVFTLLGNITVIILVKDPKLELGFAVKKSWKLLFPYLWVSILAGLIVSIGYLFFIVPGIIFAIWFFMAPYALILEGKKGAQALKRSKELVDGYFWPVLGRVLIISLIIMGSCMFLAWIPFVGMFALSVLLVPVSTVFIFLLYQNLKKVKS